MSLYRHTVSVKRQTAGAGITKTYNTVATGLACTIQPIAAEGQEQTASDYSQMYRGFFAVTADVREGDRLTDADGRVFGVRGIKLHNYGGIRLQHQELLLALDRSQA